ncbi:Uncharacterised protein [Vibrio cholerae]|nr:Uncharacterised protein [Vibrio cholerae]
MSHHSDWLRKMVTGRVAIELSGAAFLSTNTACKIPEMVNHQREVGR